MARMIPSEIPKDAPPGEKEVFDGLKGLSGSEEWVVLHSLWLATKWETTKREADFVVLIPNKGIVVIEVKSHKSVHRSSDGRWHLGRQEATWKSPFVQADDAKGNLFRLITQKFRMKSPSMESCVWFTGVHAKQSLSESPEWHEWQVLDASDLPRMNEAIVGVLRGRNQSANDGQHSDNFIDREFADDQVGKLAAKLRPKFEASMPRGEQRRRARHELDSLLLEQMQALDSMRSNSRVLFTGAAGTGKTFMAVEQARRLADLGQRGRLMCYNKNLARYLSAELRDVPNVDVSHFHQEMLRISGMSPTNGAADSAEFWREEVPLAALEVLTRSDEHQRSFLIVDEAQDLGVELHLDALDGLVEGGFAQGQIYAFADFQRQAIYVDERAEEAWSDRIPNLTRYHLDTNCRNLPHIGRSVNLVTNPPAYNLELFRRPSDGYEEPAFVLAATPEDASVQIGEYIRRLKDENFRLDDVLILSPRKASPTVRAFRKTPLGNQLCQNGGVEVQANRIRYTTIQSFKGLESPVVIVTDISDALVSNDLDELLYVGMTRARDRCIVLVDAVTAKRLMGVDQ